MCHWIVLSFYRSKCLLLLSLQLPHMNLSASSNFSYLNVTIIEKILNSCTYGYYEQIQVKYTGSFVSDENFLRNLRLHLEIFFMFILMLLVTWIKHMYQFQYEQ